MLVKEKYQDRVVVAVRVSRELATRVVQRNKRGNLAAFHLPAFDAEASSCLTDISP